MGRTVITTIVTAIIGALCVAAILAALKSRWLYVIAPKLYLNTPLSDGQIVSLTLINAGLVAEEDVAVTFRPACKFELIATSKSTLTITGKTLSLPKLSRGESVTVLLLVEGKLFATDDIQSVESKATQGKVVESKEKIMPLWQHFIAWPVMLLVLAVPFAFGTYFGSESRTSAFGYLNEKFELLGTSRELAGYENDVTEYVGRGTLEGSISAKRVRVDVIEIVRRGDVLSLKVKVSNDTGGILMGDGSIEGSAGSRGPLDWGDSRLEKFVLAPNESKTAQLKVFQPVDQSVQLLQGSYNFSSPGGSDLSVRQLIKLHGAPFAAPAK